MLVFLLACIEIPVLLLIALIRCIVRACKSRPKPAQPHVTATPQARNRVELSSEQKENIVKAILEDALLENDSAYDSLMYEGEANYPAATAANITSEDFVLQYGSKNWIDTWVKTLAMWFDCQSEYVNNGVFRLYGKEA